MNSLKENQINQDTEDYNSEPVFYCKHCLSLFIMTEEGLDDYCDKCGSTDIASCSIEEWEKLYIKKYGHKFSEE